MIGLWRVFIMRRKIDFQEEQNRESLYGGVEFLGVAGLAALAIGYLSGILLLDVTGFAYLLVTAALVLVLLDGYLQRSPADGRT